MMNSREAIEVARLVEVLGRVEGRKRLQKIVYLIREKGFTQFRQRFVLHYFGPFSRELASQIDLVSSAGLVLEEKLDGETYAYSVTPDGRGRIRQLGLNSQTPWRVFATLLNSQETGFLEALATVVFLQKAKVSEASLAKEFARIKPALKKHFASARRFAAEESLT